MQSNEKKNPQVYSIYNSAFNRKRVKYIIEKLARKRTWKIPTHTHIYKCGIIHRGL